MLTLEQQKKAIAYSIFYLIKETSDTKKIIRLCNDENIKTIHQTILDDLRSELATFRGLEDSLE